MGEDDACKCPGIVDFHWNLAPCDEAGWTCPRCRGKAPGDPPGYRPDLDVSEIEEKVSAVLMNLYRHDLVYVSNSGQGESITNAAVSACKRSGRYDQGSITRFIMGELSDGSFWKARGDAIRAGKDMRDRCACGKLATRWGGNHPPQCPEHGAASFAASLASDVPARKPGDPEPLEPWEAYGLWEAKWREDHPDDERDGLELIDEYGKMSAEELRAFFDGIEAERARKGEDHD